MVLAKEILIFNLNSKQQQPKRINLVSRCQASTCVANSYFRSFSLRRHRRSTAEPCVVADDWKPLSQRIIANRAAPGHCVSKSDIVAQGYDLLINRYKGVVHEEVDHRAPHVILDELEIIEKEITQGMKQLRGMVESGK
jgi:hypothetical protein